MSTVIAALSGYGVEDGTAGKQEDLLRHLVCIDRATGEILWEYTLPAGGYASPTTYAVDGKQYVVIAAGGGGKVDSKSGDAYVAFTLGD